MLKKTVCELFAGVGGFRLGLESSTQNTDFAPWETVYANQWEPGKKRQDAFDCYCAHFGHRPEYTNIDIGTVDKEAIPDHTLLVGGFPCQDYSVARTQAKGIDGKKGVLWWQILATLQAKHPPFVLLENVDRLLKSPARQRGRDFGIILACFWKEGYCVEWRVINAADYGFVQRRRRTFIFAYRKDTRYGNRMSHLEGESILRHQGLFAKAFPVQEEVAISAASLPTDDLVEISSSFQFPFETAGYMRDGSIQTMKAVPSYHGRHAVLRDVLDHQVGEEFYLTKDIDKWKYLKGSKRIQRVAKNGHPYIYAEGPIAFPDSIDRPARTILTSETSVSRSSHVISDPETGKLRLLTPSEVEAIQGFPKGWTNTGMSKHFRYFCMGNALVTGCIETIGSVLNEIVEKE